MPSPWHTLSLCQTRCAIGRAIRMALLATIQAAGNELVDSVAISTCSNG